MSKSEIRTPLPGIFYRKPAPDEPDFKNIGDRVAVGDVIGLVEVMKTFTQITSEVDGTVLSFRVENEEAVMPGQVLVEVET